MKALNIIKYIFSILGTAMLVGTFFIYKNTANFLETAITTSGIVTDLLETRSSSSSSNSIMYAPIVRFADSQGKTVAFTSSTSSNPASYDINESVEVVYEPNEPQNAKIKGFFSLWGGALILGILGGIFAIVGLSFFIYDSRKKKKLDDLKLNGTKIETKFLNVGVNSSLKINGSNPFIIISQWQDPATSKLHIFESDNIWFDPTSFIKSDSIRVLIDKNNPKKYHVDLSFLHDVVS